MRLRLGPPTDELRVLSRFAEPHKGLAEVTGLTRRIDSAVIV
jgi:hypothetical protein